MDFITTAEVAMMLGVTRQTILNYVNAGTFVTAIRLSARKTVFNRADVIAWIDTKKLTKSQDIVQVA